MSVGEVDLTPWGADAEVVAALGGGSRNSSWQVRIGGRLAAARSSRRSPEALDWELDLIGAANNAGVHSASLVRTRDGRRYANSVVVFEWLDGAAPTSAQEWRAVYDALSRLHDATSDWSQRPDFASVHELLSTERSADVDFASMPRAVVEECRSAWRDISGERVSAIHGDPSSNVLMVDGVPTFIDWDESRVDASMLDYVLPTIGALTLAQRRAAAACEVARSWTLEPAYARLRLEELSTLR